MKLAKTVLYRKRYATFAVFLLTTLLFSFAAIAERAGPVDIDNCQKPNPNTKRCYAPSDEMTCQWVGPKGQETCEGKEYEIKDFPDGAVESTVGHTGQQSAQCWRSTSCKVDTSGHFDRCVTDTSKWTGWTSANKTVVTDQIQCKKSPGSPSDPSD